MADTQPEPWGEDPSLDALVGAPGAAALRAMFDRLPDAMCLLWAVRGADGTIEDFKVAHDLREPVTSIAHLVALLRRRGEEPPDPRVLDRMQASTERARDLIDGVLAYARAGELRRERVALGDVMAEVADDLAPRLRAADATLEVGALPDVDGDPRQLRRLLQNLVANAVKFRGEPRRASRSRPPTGPTDGP